MFSNLEIKRIDLFVWSSYKKVNTTPEEVSLYKKVNTTPEEVSLYKKVG